MSALLASKFPIDFIRRGTLSSSVHSGRRVSAFAGELALVFSALAGERNRINLVKARKSIVEAMKKHARARVTTMFRGLRT